MGVVGVVKFERATNSVPKNFIGLFDESNRTELIYWTKLHPTINFKKSNTRRGN